MAILNFRIGHLTERSGQAARRVTQYLKREGAYAPETTQEVPEAVGYVLRSTEDTVERGDLVGKPLTGNLPAWAQGDAARFFAQAEACERGGRERAGRWATTWQMALPRELTREEQWEMGTQFVQTYLASHAYLCVMHDPVKDGEHHPHLHVLFSERIHDASVSDAATYFRRPEVGGCAKDRWFIQRGTAYALREAWADWTNYTVERLGHQEFVHPRTLRARGIDRKPEPKVGYSIDPERHVARASIRAQRDTAKEQEQAAAGWEARKQRLGLEDVQSYDSMAFLRETYQRARQQESGRWNPELARLKAVRKAAYSQRREVARQAEAQRLEADIAQREQHMADLRAMREGKAVPMGQQIAALAASEDDHVRHGLKAHIFDKERDGYGR